MNFITREEVTALAQKRVVELLSENNNNLTTVSKIIGVNKGLVSRARDGLYSESVCVALNLPVVRPMHVPICLTCGETHELKKTCDSQRAASPRRRRKAADLDPGEHGKLQSIALDRLASSAGYNSWSSYVRYLADKVIEEGF